MQGNDGIWYVADVYEQKKNDILRVSVFGTKSCLEAEGRIPMCKVTK